MCSSVTSTTVFTFGLIVFEMHRCLVMLVLPLLSAFVSVAKF